MRRPLPVLATAVAVALAFAPASCLRAEAVRLVFGSPLSRSVQNESDAAIDRACAWLADAQEPSGSWGNGDVRLTAICALALGGEGGELPKEAHEAIGRAVAWLVSPAATNADTAATARAWRDMALAVFSPQTPPDALDPPTNGLPWKAACTLQEAALLRGHPASGAQAETETNALPAIALTQLALAPPRADRHAWQAEVDAAAAALARAAPPQILLDDAEAAWWFAHAVNRAFAGELVAPTPDGPTALRWRIPLANRWTTSQRIDAHGHGHWDGPVETTAFAVLLLKEL